MAVGAEYYAADTAASSISRVNTAPRSWSPVRQPRRAILASATLTVAKRRVGGVESTEGSFGTAREGTSLRWHCAWQAGAKWPSLRRPKGCPRRHNALLALPGAPSRGHYGAWSVAHRGQRALRPVAQRRRAALGYRASHPLSIAQRASLVCDKREPRSTADPGLGKKVECLKQELTFPGDT